MTLSYKEVAEILKIIDASECEEVILELEGARLVVRRGAGSPASGGGGPVAAPAPVQASGAANADAASTAVAAPAAQAAPVAEGATVIRAPMVGTFYRRPSPDEPAFVEEGSKIEAGDPLCLIEVMKLFTTIEATVAGTVSAITAEDGVLVEFDQPLFTIDPA